RIMNYLQALLPDKRTDVILAGYQAQGTLGRELQDGQNNVRIDNEQVKVNAHIHTMSGYSAHADQDDLITFIQGIPTPPKTIFLIHSEPKTKRKFKDQLQKLNTLQGCLIES
ncbi:MAG: MBL fold metallo-hydrolase RNA specificity domain-containing protein, partial [Vibrio casei]